LTAAGRIAHGNKTDTFSDSLKLTLGIGETMTNADGTKELEYPSDVTDLRRVPLADVPMLSQEMLDSALRRLVPGSSSEQVPVAAFNSAI
jgi:FXSXX-COOH protein